MDPPPDESSMAAPWPRWAVVACLGKLEAEWREQEGRLVRNWNEAMAGEACPAAVKVVEALRKHSGHPEVVGLFVDAGIAQLVMARLKRTPPKIERRIVSWVLHFVYSESPSKRGDLRLLMAKEVSDFGRSPIWRWVIAPVLAVLKCVLEGLGEEQLASVLALKVLGPLHKPNEFAEWRDQLPLLGTYHAELEGCVCACVEASPKVGAACVFAVLDGWPRVDAASTSKEIVLIGELENLFTARKKKQPSLYLLEEFALLEAFPRFLDRLQRCVRSENWRLIERALHVWRREDFSERLKPLAFETSKALLPALIRDGEPHWNPTVNRMSLLVLERLESLDPAAFERAAMLIDKAVVVEEKEVKGSLSSDMRGWKPASGEAPPASVTGVAPWAQQAPPPKRRPMQLPSTTTTTTTEDVPNTGLERVRAFMAKCAPPVDPATGRSMDTGDRAQRQWAEALVSATPTRCPELKFHDLVFGRELGAGAFGVVKYAKRIVRAASKTAITRAAWPEVAVKVVAQEKLETLAYERSVAREICALEELSHPGISRLVSSFKWRGSVYLVLEYCASGDLFELIGANGGPLEMAGTRFVLGSVLAALESIHDTGFVYADLKPENVLLTAAGHVKLGDFGACRGTTPASKKRLLDAGRRALKDLRDGDWRSNNSLSSVEAAAAAAAAAPYAVEDEDDENEARIEGTTLYLAPEVVRGEAQEAGSDIWALGCLAHFCAEARPRVTCDTDGEARAAILAFDAATAEFAGATPKALRDLEAELLRQSPRDRPTATMLASHAFFENVDIRTLHRRAAIPLFSTANRVGTVAEKSDAKWAQRQYSMIWAPLLAQDDSASSGSALFLDADGVASNVLDIEPIPESEAERGAPFVVVAAAPTATGAKKRQPPLPPGRNSLKAISEDTD